MIRRKDIALDARARSLVISKQTLRIAMYLGLLLCDCAAIRAGFSVGVSLRGEHWLAPNGVELGWLILPIHLLVGLRNGAYARGSLTSRSDSVRHGLSAFLIATAAISMLIFFQYAGPLVSRLALAVAIVSSMGFIAVARVIFLALFITRRTDKLVGELLIVDGVVVPPQDRDVFDARAAGVIPNLQDPEALSQLAVLVTQYDRVVVWCTDERRHDWAMLLKAYNVTGEVVLSENPFGAIGIAKFEKRDTAIVSRGPLSLGNRMKKRAMDIILSLAALIFLAPLLLLVAIVIKLDSPGPALFAQPRVGRANRLFKILKFRSMRADSSDVAGSTSTQHNDARITRVGNFIRKTSIDELPQLFNVLKGDMSIVGPRPHALGSLAGDKLFWEVTERYWMRHALKPGITGLAQIRGYRGATHQQVDLENRLQADLEYINGWRLWRDVSIMFGTLRVLVHARAY